MNVNARLCSLCTPLLLAGSPAALHAGVQYTIVANADSTEAQNLRGNWIFAGGFFYGTSQFANSNLTGTVFRYDPMSTKPTVTHTFAGGANGSQPTGLIEASNGLLYGTAYEGMNNLGLVYRIDKPGNTYEILHQFTALTGGNPTGHPIEGSDNKLYGIVTSGGAFSRGGIYRIDLDGMNHQLMRAFSGVAGLTPGEDPLSLIEGPGGLLYGVTSTGGTNDAGVIFSMEKDGDPYTVLHTFPASGIRRPANELLLASDGFLYGLAELGGPVNEGGVYRIRPDGTGFQVLRRVTSTQDGHDFYQPLIEAADGYLYGVAFRDTANNGTVFRMPKNGSGYAVLHRFVQDGIDGVQPDAPLIETTPGVFYGLATYGGTEGSGIVFRMETSFENPTVRIKGPKRPKFAGNRLKLRGSATDELGLQRVEYSTGKKWKAAKGTTSWSARIPVKRGAKRVKVQIRAVDNDGLFSTIAKVRGRRVV